MVARAADFQLGEVLEATWRRLKRSRRFPGLRYSWRIGEDHLGADAVFITVVLRNRRTDYHWNELQLIDMTLGDAVLKQLSGRFYPYFEFYTAAEEHETAATAP